MTQQRIKWNPKYNPKEIKYSIWTKSQEHLDGIINSILESGGYVNKIEKREA